MPCMKESSAITRKNPPKLLFEHGKSWEERSSRQPRNKAPIHERDGAAAKLNLKDRIQGEEKHHSF